MKGRSQRGKVFNRYILSYGSMLLISVILGLTLIHDASEYVRSEYYVQETGRSRIIAAQFDATMEQLNSLNYLLLSNSSRISCALDPSPYNEWELVKALSEYQSVSKTDVITFLCNASSDRVYDVAGTYTSDVFWHKRLEMKGREDMRSDWLKLEKPELLPYVDDEGRACLMYVYPLKSTSIASYDKQSFIVHYFPARILSNLSKLLLDNDADSQFVFCFEGKPVFASSGVTDEMLSTILATGDTEDIADVDEGYVFWQEMVYPGLRMALFVGDGNLMYSLRNYLQMLCYVMTSFVFVGIFMAIFFSSRQYEPVQQAMRMLPDGNYDGEDEFKYIISGIEGIHQSNLQITGRLHEQCEVIRQQCLMRLFNGFSVSEDELQAADIVLEEGVFAVICVRTKDSEAAAALKAFLNEHTDLLHTEADEDDLRIVLAARADAGVIYQTFADMLDGLNADAGIGIHEGGVSGISSAYLQAIIACEESEKRHISPVMFDSIEFNYTDSDKGNQTLALLELALKNGSEVMVKANMEALIETIRNMNYADGKCMRFAFINLLRRISAEGRLKLRTEYML